MSRKFYGKDADQCIKNVDAICAFDPYERMNMILYLLEFSRDDELTAELKEMIRSIILDNGMVQLVSTKAQVMSFIQQRS